MTEPASNPTLTKDKHPGDRFWETYLEAANKEDEFLPGSWEANTGGVLTFTGLFAATVAAFLIESYKSLSPDSGDETIIVLRQLLAVSVNASTQMPVNPVIPDPFQATPTAIAVNSLWFLSLLISLFCALLSTLIQEWARDYRRDVAKRRKLNESPSNRAFNHIYVRMAIDRYGMDHVVYLITTLVHLSVLLFAIGLVMFLWPINNIVASATAGVLGIFLMTYAAASALPLLDRSCPYRTPVTYFYVVLLWLLGAFLFTIIGSWREMPPPTVFIRMKTGRSISSFVGFLKSAQFAFAWDRTSPHMMDNQDEFKELLGSLGPIIRDTDENKAEQFARVWSDNTFFQSLRVYVQSDLNLESGSRQPVDIGHLQVFATLLNSMFVFDDKHPDGHEIMYSYAGALLDTLSRIRLISENVNDTEERIVARLCITSATNHYLQARVLASKRGIQIPNAPPTPRILFGYREPYYLSKDLFYPPRHSSWLPTNMTPLHDGNCCADSQTLLIEDTQHVIASNALTAVILLLDADFTVRARVGMPEWLSQFGKIFEADTELRGHWPSKQFVEVLRVAGLEEWLQPGSDFGSEPSSASAHYEYLSHEGSKLVPVLRVLAESVNWDEHHRLHPFPRSSPHRNPVDVYIDPSGRMVISKRRVEPARDGDRSTGLDDAQLGGENETSGSAKFENSGAFVMEGADSAAAKVVEADNKEDRQLREERSE